jgi:(p)ppGpp synthase/HD superfamily hydrolase
MNDLIAKAHIYCVAKHAFQKRKYSGDPYYIHPLRVSDMILEVPYLAGHHIYNRAGGTYQAVTHDGLVAIALLYDIIEDTPTTYQDIEKIFGDIVAQGVTDLTSTSKIDAPNANRATRKELDRQKIQTKPAWIRLIKCCDRYDNLLDTLNYVMDWNIQKKLPESGWFYKYIQESRDLLEVLNVQELESIYGREFFEKYNLNMLMDNLKLELDHVTQEVKNV